MFFKKIDYISPDITLFHNSDDKHSSIASGILTLVAYLIIIISALYDLVILFKRSTFTTYFYTRYSEEINTMIFSDNEFFHYVAFNRDIDESIVNIVGVESAPNLYDPGQTIGYPSLEPVNEYFYEKCTLDDLKNHENLVSDKTQFLKSYCLHKMYDYSTKKIIDKSDAGFVFPKIDNIDKSVYSIIVKKCTNDEATTGYKRNCASDDKIASVNIENFSAKFHSIDRYVDVGNFKKPVSEYNFNKEIGLNSGNNFVINKINYHNVLINSHEGYLFDSTKKTNTLVFESNEISYNVGHITTTGILCTAEYWNSGKISIYEREYQTLLDVFSNIGGIIELIGNIFSFINFFFNNFTIYNDSINIYFENKVRRKMVKINDTINDGIKNEDVNSEENINPNILIKRSKKKVKKANINNLVFDEQTSSNMRNKAKSNQEKIEANNNDCKINDECNNSKNLEEKKFYDINFFKYIYLLITRCCSSNSQKYFKYCDLREEIISENFLYKVYFEIIDKNATNTEEVNIKNINK